VNEFELIDLVLSTLGDTASGDPLVLGPGDDSAAVLVPAGSLLVSSIDSLLADVHFPADAPAALIGYRSLMVSLSDLAAMGAEASHVLVSLTLNTVDAAWVRQFALGMREAALSTGVKIAGGNISRGPLAIHVSVHGFCPPADLLRRDTAQVGDQVFVTGALGGAAAAVAEGFAAVKDVDPDAVTPLQQRYFKPQARLSAGKTLRGTAHAAIDVSDGLLQDLGHLMKASDLQARIDSSLVPVFPGADLAQALHGGDDYELLFTAAAMPAQLGVAVSRIGELVSGSGILVDGKQVTADGYRHF